MACKYCGKDNMLIMDNILTGGVCTECRNKVREKLDENKDKIQLFYDKVQELGLMNVFVHNMNILKTDCGILQLKSVKEDKRRTFPIVLVFTGVTNKAVQEIEISIIDKNMKITYTCGAKVSGIIIENTGKCKVLDVKERKMPKGEYLR